MTQPNSLRDGKKILIVDDHADTLALWLEYMRMHGYDVTGATDAGEALRIARQQHVDLLITDVQMPHVDGWDLFVQLRQLHPRLRGIVASAHGMRQHLEKSARLGFDEHLVKPLNPDDLTRAVDRVLDELSKN